MRVRTSVLPILQRLRRTCVAPPMLPKLFARLGGIAKRPGKFLLLASGPFLLVPHEGQDKATLRQRFTEKYGNTLARHDGKPILYCIMAANIFIFAIWQYAQYSSTPRAA